MDDYIKKTLESVVVFNTPVCLLMSWMEIRRVSLHG